MAMAENAVWVTVRLARGMLRYEFGGRQVCGYGGISMSYVVVGG